MHRPETTPLKRASQLIVEKANRPALTIFTIGIVVFMLAHIHELLAGVRGIEIFLSRCVIWGLFFGAPFLVVQRQPSRTNIATLFLIAAAFDLDIVAGIVAAVVALLVRVNHSSNVSQRTVPASAPDAVGEHDWAGRSPPWRMFRPAGNLGLALKIMLGLKLLLSLLSLGSDLLQLNLAARLMAGANMPAGELNSNAARQTMLGIICLLIYLATAIVFVIWFHRAHANLGPLGARHLAYTSGWAAGCWFVPILNLFRPVQIAQEIWRNSDPNTVVGDDVHPGRSANSKLIGFWWTMFITSNAVGNIAFRMAFRVHSPASLWEATFACMIASVATILAAALALAVVVGIDTRQTARAEALRMQTGLLPGIEPQRQEAVLGLAAHDQTEEPRHTLDEPITLSPPLTANSASTAEWYIIAGLLLVIVVAAGFILARSKIADPTPPQIPNERRAADTYFSFGNASMDKKDYNQAIRDYSEAIEKYPHFLEAFYNRGIAWFKMREYEMAIADFTEAIRLDPSLAKAYHSRSIAHEKMNEHDKANQDRRVAYRLEGIPEVWLSKKSRFGLLHGTVHNETGRTIESLKLLIETAKWERVYEVRVWVANNSTESFSVYVGEPIGVERFTVLRNLR